MEKETIRHFTQNNENLISLGTSKGFAVIDISDLKCIINRRHFDKGIGIVSPYCIDNKLTNLLCFVGKGPSPFSNEKTFAMWDDNICQLFAKSEFNTNIIDQKIENNKLFVSSSSVLYVYNFNPMENLFSLDCHNGIFDTKKILDGDLIVHAKNSTNKNFISIVQIFSVKDKTEIKFLEEFKYDIGTIKINNQGSMFAVICSDGKRILLYELTKNGPIMKQKWYRGKNPTKIMSVSFDEKSTLLAVTSNTGTIHIYDILNPEKNSKSSVPFGWIVSGYFLSVWYRFRIYTTQHTDATPIGCYFNQGDFFILCTDGLLLRFTLNSKNEEYELIDHKNILNFIDSQFNK